jgi:spore coat polysaccharide biosynthesis protein SpsF
MRIVAIVQARMGSTRLPGKVLSNIGGKTVLSRVVQRLRHSAQIEQLLVATTSKSADDAIVEECRRCSVAVFRGAEQDVLDRYYRAAQFARADVIVRITADCPLIDSEVADRTIQAFLDAKPDYASNTLERTYPRGLDTEVISTDALACAWREAKEPYQRSHVTPYLYQNPKVFRLLSVKGEGDYSSHRWTLDTPEDLEFIHLVYDRFIDQDDFHWHHVLALIEGEPAMAKVNGDIAQKALHEG